MIGLQAADGKTGEFVDVAAEIGGQLLAGGLAATGGEHSSRRELKQPLHEGMAPVDQENVVIRQAGKALFHQGTHVVDPAHLFRQQDQGRRGVISLEGLHLDRHLVVAEGVAKDVSQSFASILALGIAELGRVVLEIGIEFGINPLEAEFAVATFQPGDELRIDQAIGKENLSALAFPQSLGSRLTRLIGAVKKPIRLVGWQTAAVARQGGETALAACDRILRRC